KDCCKERIVPYSELFCQVKCLCEFDQHSQNTHQDDGLGFVGSKECLYEAVDQHDYEQITNCAPDRLVFDEEGNKSFHYQNSEEEQEILFAETKHHPTKLFIKIPDDLQNLFHGLMRCQVTVFHYDSILRFLER